MNEGNVSAEQALERLRAGNGRFVAGVAGAGILAAVTRRSELGDAQWPFAIVLGCSDSRVPVEIVFDQGVGDLFVIRVAGNVVAPSLIGSVEFAAARFGTRLVVVLGHSSCGAIQATLEQMRRPVDLQSPNLRSIVERIRPGLVELVAGSPGDEDELLQQAVRANIRASVQQLRRGSRIIESLIDQEGLRVVGARYSLATGVVDYLEDTL
ncbi:MAG: carbonic anhydrase [Gammaproteobacteria bacterium]|nr:MAG: carbonic anhydrase [Gammaproteobacteria bacterium]